jgi:hypothetical protein
LEEIIDMKTTSAPVRKLQSADGSMTVQSLVCTGLAFSKTFQHFPGRFQSFFSPTRFQVFFAVIHVNHVKHVQLRVQSVYSTAQDKYGKAGVAEI